MSREDPPIVHTITSGCIQANVHYDLQSDSMEYTITVARFDAPGIEAADAVALGPTNIPLLMSVLDQAYAWITQHKASHNNK